MTTSVASTSDAASYSKLYDPNNASAPAAGDTKFDALVGSARRDFEICMVFRYKTSKDVKFEETGEEAMGTRGSMKQPEPDQRQKMQMWKQKREGILKSLQNCGLHVFCYYGRDRDEIFCKIGAPAQKLRDTAARMKYKLQLKSEYLGAYAEFRHDFPGRPELHYRDRRVVSHMYRTHTDDEYPGEDAIFTALDKVHLVHHIITSKDKDCAGINVGQLLHSGGNKKDNELKDYYPLHDTLKLQELSASKLAWIFMGSQHANAVRDYFGDKIAFYYLFMAFYWQWLLLPAAVGLVLQLIDVICGTPDNFTAIPFCVFLSVWTYYLPHFWKREEAKYATSWGTLDMVKELESCRPEHTGEPRINPVTAQVEPYYPFQKRIWKYVFSGVIVILSGVMLTGVILMILFLKHTRPADSMLGRVGYQFLLAFVVEVVNAILTCVAKCLTDRENHRTQTEHEMHMLAKVMGFKFVNSYFALYYIAFFKKDSYLFGSQITCMREDCFLDLQSQLAIFVLFRLTIMNVVSFVWPKFLAWWRAFRTEGSVRIKNTFNAHRSLELADMSQAEQESKKENYDVFHDMDETCITHGYATLMGVTSPWVLAAVLLWVVLEICLDSKGLTADRKRSLPVKRRSNEPWDTAFEIYGVLAVFTNIVLLVFASDQYKEWALSERLVLFIYLGHTILLSRLVIRAFFPEVPRSVELLQLKQQNMVHRCLENIKIEHQQDLSMFRDSAGERMEVFEQDLYDDNEDIEPELSLRGSASAFKSGMVESLAGGLVLAVVVMFIIATVVALFMFLFADQ